IDAQALPGRQLGCFCFRFRPRGQKTTDSTERLDGLANELRGSRRTLQRGKRANSTMSLLQNIPGGSNRKNSSPRFARSIDAACCRAGDLGGSSTRDFSSTSNLNPLTSRIPLLFPRIAVRVIAVSFPETKLVVIQQQEPAHPLHALPRIQMRHD